MIVSELKEFLLKGPVEAFVPRIVLGGSGSAPPVVQIEGPQSFLEVPVELTPVVGMDMDDVPVEEVVETIEEVLRSDRGMGRVHPRIGDAGMFIDGSDDIPLQTVPIQHDAVEVKKESHAGLLFKISHLFLGFSTLSVGLPCFLLPLEMVGLDDPLNVPGGDSFLVLPFIQDSKLLLAVSRIAFPESDDPSIFEAACGTLPSVSR